MLCDDHLVPRCTVGGWQLLLWGSYRSSCSVPGSSALSGARFTSPLCTLAQRAFGFLFLFLTAKAPTQSRLPFALPTSL